MWLPSSKDCLLIDPANCCMAKKKKIEMVLIEFFFPFSSQQIRRESLMALSYTHFNLHPAGLRYLAPALHAEEGIDQF